jgi:predicted phosphohydrolase
MGSYEDLDHSISHIPNVTYLYQRVVMLNGIAIVGVNGWWTFDLDINLDQEQAWTFFLDRYKIPEEQAGIVLECAYRDSVYLQNTIDKLQTHKDVKKILVVSHTVPGLDFIKHDSELSDTYRINLMGNSQLLNCLEQDTNKKITNWVFGHYHGRVDQAAHNIRFCNNPKGRADDIYNSPYFPLRIDIEF